MCVCVCGCVCGCVGVCVCVCVGVCVCVFVGVCVGAAGRRLPSSFQHAQTFANILTQN